MLQNNKQVRPNTHSLATADLDNWNQIISDTFCPMSCQSGADTFNGYVNLGRLDAIRLATIGGCEMEVVRNRQHIAQVCDNYYLVKFQLDGGSRINHQGREAILNPGDFVLCSSSDPYSLSFDGDFRQAVLSIRQQQLDELVPNTVDTLGLAMNGEDPVNGMLSQFVYSLTRRYDRLQPPTLRRMEANVLDLLVTSLQAKAKPTLAQSESVQTGHLLRIKRFIAMHLQDHRLSPDFIAEAEGIGTRYLHKLFKVEGLSVSRYIQQKRLELCARVLADPLQMKLSTLDIALNAGLNDVSHFHRCFKAAYGITPRQYRLQACASLK